MEEQSIQVFYQNRKRGRDRIEAELRKCHGRVEKMSKVSEREIGRQIRRSKEFVKKFENMLEKKLQFRKERVQWSSDGTDSVAIIFSTVSIFSIF